MTPIINSFLITFRFWAGDNESYKDTEYNLLIVTDGEISFAIKEAEKYDAEHNYRGEIVRVERIQAHSVICAWLPPISFREENNVKSTN